MRSAGSGRRIYRNPTNIFFYIWTIHEFFRRGLIFWSGIEQLPYYAFL